MSGFIAALDEAEAFGDINVELVAEFSLLSLGQNLQQGNGQKPAENTCGKTGILTLFFSHSHMLALLLNSWSRFRVVDHFVLL